MTAIKFTAPCKRDGTAGWETLVASSEFNALADGYGVDGPELDNSSSRWRYMCAHFKMTTSTVSPSDGAQLEIYILPAGGSGDTYPGYEETSTAANLPPTSYKQGAIVFRAKATQSIEGIVWNIPIPPCKFKVFARNSKMNGSSALPSSSTNMVLEGQFYNEEIV